jgi:hypothetical protein
VNLEQVVSALETIQRSTFTSEYETSSEVDIDVESFGRPNFSQSRESAL